MAVAAVISAVRRPLSPRRPTDSTDAQLARRAAEGDESAFEAIYDRYAPGLLVFCRQLLGSREEAEDALQQSLARAYGALRAGRDPGCLKAWLYAIARNRCLTLLAARRVIVDLGAVPPADDCYVEVQRRADVGDLVDDLRRLPEDQRVALVLFELGGHSQRDIAAVLGVMPVRVKALVFQAREGLARAREARAAACRDVLEELAVLRGAPPRRGPLADHLARCDACAAFTTEVARQRRALAVVILPAVPPVALKAKVLGTALTGGGGAAAATGGTGGTGIVAAVAAGGAGAGGGALTVAGAGAGGAGVLGAAAAGTAGLAGVGSLATVGAGGVAAGLAAKGVVAKIITAVAIAGSAVSAPPTTRPADPVAPSSIAPIAADRVPVKPGAPADEPHSQTLPSPAPGPADQPAAPTPAAATVPAPAAVAAPAAASTTAPAPTLDPAPAAQAAPAAAADPGGTAAPAAPEPAAAPNPTTADTGGEAAAPVPATTADPGGAQPVDPGLTDTTTAGGARPTAESP